MQCSTRARQLTATIIGLECDARQSSYVDGQLRLIGDLVHRGEQFNTHAINELDQRFQHADITPRSTPDKSTNRLQIVDQVGRV